jgi:aspartyl-tRNA(Asn)/glutamyl-tRNA(Gln) amidotransferase subunit B
MQKMQLALKAVIGLELHIQVDLEHKAFCRCQNEFDAEANSNTCPTCLGQAGAMPVLNKEIIESAIKLAHALNSNINRVSSFDRKHYFYHDMPKGYQITQYRYPIAEGGSLDINSKSIGIERIHIEEDSAKSKYIDDQLHIDYNRAGVGLLELVTKPDIESSQEASAFLSELILILDYLGICRGDMENGTLRCDCNISMTNVETNENYGRIEVKNLNSLGNLRKAIEYEIERQSYLIVNRTKVDRETRKWSEKSSETRSLRSKELIKDYRYLPEPDLQDIIISEKLINLHIDNQTILPMAKRLFLVHKTGLKSEQAKILVANKAKLLYYDEVAILFPALNSRLLASWIINDLTGIMNDRKINFESLSIRAEDFGELLEYVHNEMVSQLTAKDVLKEMIASDHQAKDIIDRRNLWLNDGVKFEKEMQQLVAGNIVKAREYLAEHQRSSGYFVGRLMKISDGTANPKKLSEFVKKYLVEHKKEIDSI